MNDYTGNKCNIKEILYYSINHKGHYINLQSAVANLNDIPDKAHHSLSFKYLKCSLGQKKAVLHSFLPSKFSQWPFLHYDETKDIVFFTTFA